MKKSLPKFLTLKEASKATGIAVLTLRGWLRHDRTFPAVKIKGRIFIKPNDFWYWLEINGRAVAV